MILSDALILPVSRSGDLEGTGGIVPLKYLGRGDGSAFIPQCLENVIKNCHSEKD